jgi:hypothetical protein
MSQCDLCGLDSGPQPYRQRFEGTEKSFCCLGCLNVYSFY